jgi:hypothetical protein
MQRKLEALRRDVGEAALRDSTYATVEEDDELQVWCAYQHICGRACGHTILIVMLCTISSASTASQRCVCTHRVTCKGWLMWVCGGRVSLGSSRWST